MLKALLVALLLVFTWTSAASAQCTKDAQCKSPRVCLASGVCGIPESPKACTVDIDCPGAEVCGGDGYCRAPDETAEDDAEVKPETQSSPRPGQEEDKRPSETNRSEPIVTPVVQATTEKKKTTNRWALGSGFSIGARLALGLSWGDIGVAEEAESIAVDPEVPTPISVSGGDQGLGVAVVPVWLNIGYRINADHYVGGFAALGPVTMHCNDGKITYSNGATVELDYGQCSAGFSRFGLEWLWHPPITKSERIRPWVGFGAGIEALALLYDFALRDPGGTVELNADVTERYSGIEYGSLQAGLDFRIYKKLVGGPFGMLSIGEYTDFDNEIVWDMDEIQDTRTSSRMDRITPHGWVMAGVRLSFN